VRRLEREGIIMGYNARLNPQHLKGSLLVFVEISLDYKSGDTFEEFRRAVLKLPTCWSATWCQGISTIW
jgi:Lrp/AsnC family leucine-responsive transcriptional regulator